MKIRKGDRVVVLSGKDKGAEGKVIQVLRDEDRVIVEGVNRVKRHTKVVQSGGRQGTTGGIITTEAPIHVSNVMLVDGDGVRHATKVAWRALALLQTELEEVAEIEAAHGKTHEIEALPPGIWQAKDPAAAARAIIAELPRA